MTQFAPTNRIAFQGELGAYSHEACRNARPGMEPLPCRAFEDVIEAVRSGQADLAMLPVENSTYGRVADIHRLLPESGLHIVDEAFVRVHISLMLLPQSSAYLARYGIRGESAADSAGAAAELSQSGKRDEGVLASDLAAEIHGLNILARHIEDHAHNTTRFLIMSREDDHARRAPEMMTTFVFRVRNIPAALYKAMGGFATNGVNMTKLESYMADGVFTATQFYADIEGHPEDPHVKRALDELGFFSSSLTILGVYPADPLRAEQRQEIEAEG